MIGQCNDGSIDRCDPPGKAEQSQPADQPKENTVRPGDPENFLSGKPIGQGYQIFKQRRLQNRKNGTQVMGFGCQLGIDPGQAVLVTLAGDRSRSKLAPAMNIDRRVKKIGEPKRQAAEKEQQNHTDREKARAAKEALGGGLGHG
jgi:hypothetical protein